MKAISIGNRSIGPNHPIFIVAEVGVNHNGDIQLARDCIKAAAEAGADAVKFQKFRAEEFIVDRELTYTYESQGQTTTEKQYEMFKRLELPRESLADLKNLSDSLGIIFFSSPMSQSGINDLIDIGTPLLKNGSDALTHLPLIRAMGESGLLTVLSTGMADINDIENAVDIFRKTGNEKLILLACTSMYPTPPGQVNVSRVATLSEKFNCLSGFSDHTDGNVAAISSVGFGCCFIEKHFTMDRNLSGPDHQFSIDPEGLRDLVNAIRVAELSIGDGEIQPSPGEEKGRIEYRLSCIASRDLSAGTNLQEADVIFSRPGTGMSPIMLDEVIGRKLISNVSIGQMFDIKDLE